MKKFGMFTFLLALLALVAQAAEKDLTVKNFVSPSTESAAHPLPGSGPFVVTRTLDFAAEGKNVTTNDELVVVWLPADAVALYAVAGTPEGFGTTNAIHVTPRYYDEGSNTWSNVVSQQTVTNQPVTSASTSVTAKKYAVKLDKVPAEGAYFISVFGYRYGE